MKVNLQLFGGRGGGSGLGSGGGQYGDRNAPAAQQYRKDLAELANANMSNSDLQAAVEAYAMTHKGIDEETMLRNVREYQDFADNPDGLSPQMRDYLNEAGLKMKETTQKTTKQDALDKLREVAYTKTLTTSENSDVFDSWNKMVKVAEKAGVSHEEMRKLWNEYKFKKR